MNCYAPRQIEATGRWNYTGMNDGRVWTHPSCDDHKLEGHATANDARRCAALYQLEQSDFDAEFGGWTDCEADGCEAPTKAGANIRGIGMANTVALCPEHQTREQLALLIGDMAGDVMSS